jgi:hypothetical protein
MKTVSSTIVIAPTGHSSAHISQPLQYSRSIVGGIVRVMTLSGQKSQQVKQAILFVFAGIHLSKSITGRLTRHEPVLPPSPGPGSLWDFRQPNLSFFIFLHSCKIYRWQRKKLQMQGA